MCRDRGAKIVVDTSGQALKQIVGLGGIWLIKPNVEELCELLGKAVEDSTLAIAAAGRKLCDKSEIVLVSRGAKGALLVTDDKALNAQCAGGKEALGGTVGCGDYLLAGFLDGFEQKRDLDFALSRAIKVAAARAWGQTESMSWPDVKSRIDVGICEVR